MLRFLNPSIPSRAILRDFIRAHSDTAMPPSPHITEKSRP